jgi:hypothetical protein
LEGSYEIHQLEEAFLTFLDQNPPFELPPDNGNMARLREIGGRILGAPQGYARAAQCSEIEE